MNNIKSTLRLNIIAFMIFISVGVGGISLTGCSVNQGQVPDSSQTGKSREPAANLKPNVTPTSSTTVTSAPPTVGPPPPVPWKPMSYQEIQKNSALRLMKEIREKEKEIDLPSIESLPESESEIRLWYFPPYEKMRGVVFSGSDELRPVILIKENSKEEMPLNQETFDRLTRILNQSNLENLKDSKSIEVLPSPGASYLVYQIKSGSKVISKFYPAGIGTNVKPTEPTDLCIAAELCRELSELLSLSFDACRCSPPE